MSTPETNPNQSNESSTPPVSQDQMETGGNIDNPQSLPTVVVGVDERPDVKEPSLPIIGFNLSSFVLFIISGFILFLTIYLFTKQFEASSLIKIPTQANIPDSTYARKIELIRMIQEEKKSYREFTIQMSQMVLLNLLLPVLTAILGYIFASNKNTNNT
jgi:VIT1/CCC1 family predicted Fe2+/Mn2+ transporter